MLLKSCVDSTDLPPKPETSGANDSAFLDPRGPLKEQVLRTSPISHGAARPETTIKTASVGDTNKTRSDEKILGNGTASATQREESKNVKSDGRPWHRALALLSLGLYYFVASGMSTVLAAEFSDVAQTYNIGISTISLSTAFYMLGLGIGGILASPTSKLYGKKPVYTSGAILFTVSAVWCAISSNYSSLVIARIVQGQSIYVS